MNLKQNLKKIKKIIKNRNGYIKSNKKERKYDEPL